MAVDPNIAPPSQLDELLGGNIPDENAPAPSSPEPSTNYADKGTFIGGMGGAQLGVTNPPLRAVGAMAGGTAGHFVGAIMDDVAQGNSMSLDRVAQHMADASKAGLVQGSAEAAVPLLGQVFTGIPPVRKGLERGIGWIGKKLGDWILPLHPSPDIQTAEKIVKGSGGPGLTAGQMYDAARGQENQFVRIGENIASASWAPGIIREVYNGNERAVQQAFSNFQSQMEKLSPKDAEGVFDQVINGRMQDKMLRPMTQMMTDLRQRAPSQFVNANPVLNQLRDTNSVLGNNVVGGLKRIRDSYQDKATVQNIDKLIDLLENAPKAAPNLTLDQASFLKTELGRLGNKNYAPSPENDAFKLAAQRLSAKVNDAIKAGLTKQEQLTSDTNLLRDYERANAFYSAAAERYRNDFVRGTLDTLEKKPGSLARVLLPKTIPSESEHLAKIEAIKSAYGPRWNVEMRPLMLATLAGRAYNDVEQRYSGKLLARELESYGSNVIDAVAGTNGGQKLMDFARTLEKVADRPKGTGSVAIQLATAGAVGSSVGAAGYAITGDTDRALETGAGTALATVVLGPRLLGNLLANPRLLDAMKTGLFQFQTTGRPPNILIQTLRQAGAAAAGSSAGAGQELTPEQARAVASPSALPRKAGQTELRQAP